MKKLLLIALIGIGMMACKKKEADAPIPTERIRLTIHAKGATMSLVTGYLNVVSDKQTIFSRNFNDTIQSGDSLSFDVTLNCALTRTYISTKMVIWKHQLDGFNADTIGANKINYKIIVGKYPPTTTTDKSAYWLSDDFHT